MASVFRRRIFSQVIPVLKSFLDKGEYSHFYDSIPQLLTFSQPKGLQPQFELAWKDIVKLKPQLKTRVHPATVLTYLKNQDFPTNDGITNIYMDQSKLEKFIFTVEQELFTSSVILNICYTIQDLPNKSCFFRNVIPENVLFEYSSPNIAKPFHYGHFRSTIIGNFLANIYQYVGHNVTKINYIGDWGLQYGILAVGFNHFGSEEKLKEDPLDHLFEVYKKANGKNAADIYFNEEAKKYFKKMEDGDAEALFQWQKLRDLSLKEMNATYKQLNVYFDEIHGESMYNEKSKEIFDVLLNNNLASCNEDGSIETILRENNKEEKVILRKCDGTSLYISRDIAAAIDRKQKFLFDSMYYVVDSTQSKHFSHLKSILKAMGFLWASDLHHVPYGRVLNFSTRKGTVVFLHDILNEAKERTLDTMQKSPNTKVTENLEDIADILGITCLIINDFSSKRKKESVFNWEKVLSVKGDSGNSLQYCHARLSSIKANCGFDLCLNCGLQSLIEPEAISLISCLSNFEQVIYNTYVELEPYILVHYLFALRNEIGRAVKALPVKGSNPDIGRIISMLMKNLVLKIAVWKKGNSCQAELWLIL